MKKLAEQSRAQQEAFIHRQAQDMENIVFTRYVLRRMATRQITARAVVEVLRNGRMRRPAELSIKTGKLECLLDRCVASREIGVVVAIDAMIPILSWSRQWLDGSCICITLLMAVCAISG